MRQRDGLSFTWSQARLPTGQKGSVVYRLAQVSDGFARDLWDVIQADLRALGMTRPEQGLRLLERVATSLAGQLVLRTLGEELDVSHDLAPVEPGQLPEIRSEAKRMARGPW